VRPGEVILTDATRSFSVRADNARTLRGVLVGARARGPRPVPALQGVTLHIDPGAGWFPHYAGYATERGRGAGEGFNRNLPLAPETGDGDWLTALSTLGGEARALDPDAVVVSLGLDAAAADPESPLRVTEAGYFAAGRRIGALGPAVLIQEGGYDLASLGRLAVAAIEGAAAGAFG